MQRTSVTRVFCLVTASSIAFASLPASAARPATPTRPPAAYVTKNVTRTTLPNGLEVVVLVDRVAPVVSTWLNVRSGSDDEPFEGLAHAQEHMFYRGSRTLSGAQSDEIAGFTGDEDNADTQAIVTQFYHTVPSADLDLMLHVDASRFSGLLDSQHDWDQERGAIEQEVTRENSDASFRLGVKIQHHLMAGTPYADDGLGTMKSFGTQIQAPQLQGFYRRWYHPNNAVYVIAGDVDPAAAIASVTKYFGGVPAAKLPARPAARLGPLTPATFSDTSDEGSNLVLIGYRFPGLADPDYAASVVLLDALNSQRGAAYALVASGKALDIETDPTEFPTAGIAQIAAHVPVTTAPKAAVAEIEAVIDRYRKTGIPRDLVDAARRRELAQAETAGSSIRTLAATWSGTLPAEHRTPDEDTAAILSVTPADVNRVLRRYLVNATAAVAYAVPKNGASGQSGGTAGGAETKAEPTVLAPLPPWAQSALDALQLPPAPEPPAEFTLANGLHVIVKPDHSSAAVVVAGQIANEAGLQEPAHQAGVGSVVEALMPYGTQTSSRLQFQANVDAISADVKTGFAFSLSSLSADFDRGMTLLADDELHPALRASDFAIVRDQRAAVVAGDATTPAHLSQVALANGLYPEGDPERWFPAAADIKALTLDDVRAYYHAAFRPDLTTIAIVGDVTPEQAQATVERTFGSWRLAGAKPSVVALPVRDNASASTKIPANGVVQDTVTMAQTLAFGNADKDFSSLQLAETMLSGDFSSILIRDMRVTTGYVYYVSASVRARRKRSTFNVVYGCAPQNYSKAETVLERDLTQMQTADVDAARLQRAKASLLSAYALSRESYDDLATKTARDAAEGLSPADLYTRVQREFATTAADVRAAAARWLRPAGFVRTIQGPAPT